MPASTATIVIFGAFGDLTRRKLIPALYHLYCNGHLPEALRIVGVDRVETDTDGFRAHHLEGAQTFVPDIYTSESWSYFGGQLHYVQADITSRAGFGHLKDALTEIEGAPSDRLYYLAVPPLLHKPIVENLSAHQMEVEDEGWRRVIVEKPFGYDLGSAQELNASIHQVFEEQQIFRIDHYLGKETAQNILFLRFANTLFELMWNRNTIDNVQITVAESVDVGHRAAYYDRSGVLRDMFQNHLLQLLTLVAMEPPAILNANALRNEKVKVLESIRPVNLADTVRAQYADYRETEGVDQDSQTATYAALKLFIDNWRWQDVPFYLRSGKALNRKTSEIIVTLKRPPSVMFDRAFAEQITPNMLAICVQPDEGAHFTFQAKLPDSTAETRPVDMEFHYASAFGERRIPDAYERLILDALEGDAALFIRSDEIEAAWHIVDPIISGWADGQGPTMATYERGSWGPTEADDLLGRDGRTWEHSCSH
ncbi:MAG: glucose-6-phosphate dehydrogenase [Chloroflexi bacterium]|nr:glucose-6-phosphate dehydrogenase [Chloroflexota bacterium]